MCLKTWWHGMAWWRHGALAEMEKGGRSGRAECANFSQLCSFLFVFHAFFAKFLAFLLIFARFWAFFAHILCPYFSGSKFCQRYFVSFFHLCPYYVPGVLLQRIPWFNVQLYHNHIELYNATKLLLLLLILLLLQLGAVFLKSPSHPFPAKSPTAALGWLDWNYCSTAAS